MGGLISGSGGENGFEREPVGFGYNGIETSEGSLGGEYPIFETSPNSPSPEDVADVVGDEAREAAEVVA